MSGSAVLQDNDRAESSGDLLKNKTHQIVKLELQANTITATRTCVFFEIHCHLKFPVVVMHLCNIYIYHKTVLNSMGFFNIKCFRFSIWLKSDLYLRYLIEDLITPYYWSCSSELCMNFVFAYCVMISTNQIVYFKCSAVFFKMTKVV